MIKFFILLIVVAVLFKRTYVKTFQIVNSKYLICVSYPSIKMVKKQQKEGCTLQLKISDVEESPVKTRSRQ